jgi:hypothetical protein
MKKASGEVWRWMFKIGANNPQAWRVSADGLLRAARAVGAAIRPSPEGTTDAMVSVQAMLIGMAIECALKARWLKQGRRFATPGAGFSRDGKLDLNVMWGARGHNLRAMAATVGLSNEADLALLDRLSQFVKWAGRYPVPGSAEQMTRPTKHAGPVSARVISVEDVTQANVLAKRLLAGAAPWLDE